MATAARWNKPNPTANPAGRLGFAVLDFYDFRHQRFWVWVAFAVTISWIVLLNILLLLAFSLLPGKLLKGVSYQSHQHTKAGIVCLWCSHWLRCAADHLVAPGIVYAARYRTVLLLLLLAFSLLPGIPSSTCHASAIYFHLSAVEEVRYQPHTRIQQVWYCMPLL